MTLKAQLSAIADGGEKLTELLINAENVEDYPELLEKAHASVHNALIAIRMRKLMDDFRERETDIYVVTYPKSGTTLTQMILYQLTTDGNMDFHHLYDVSPWCRFSAFYQKEMPSVGARRIIKSHDSYQFLRRIRKGKFIFVIRDGLDVLSSLYQHILDYNDPALQFKNLVTRKMKDWFDYLKDWLQNPADLPILYVHYQDLVHHKRETVLKMADFAQIEVNEALMQRVLERTSFSFMKAHQHKFGEQPDQWKVYDNFIRKGNSGEGRRNFTDDQLREYQALSTDFLRTNPYTARYFASPVIN